MEVELRFGSKAATDLLSYLEIGGVFSKKFISNLMGKMMFVIQLAHKPKFVPYEGEEYQTYRKIRDSYKHGLEELGLSELSRRICGGLDAIAIEAYNKAKEERENGNTKNKRRN